MRRWASSLASSISWFIAVLLGLSPWNGGREGRFTRESDCGAAGLLLDADEGEHARDAQRHRLAEGALVGVDAGGAGGGPGSSFGEAAAVGHGGVGPIADGAAHGDPVVEACDEHGAPFPARRQDAGA